LSAFTPRPDQRDYKFWTLTGAGHDWPIAHSELIGYIEQRVELHRRLSGPTQTSMGSGRKYPLPPADAMRQRFVMARAAAQYYLPTHRQRSSRATGGKAATAGPAWCDSTRGVSYRQDDMDDLLAFCSCPRLRSGQVQGAWTRARRHRPGDRLPAPGRGPEGNAARRLIVCAGCRDTTAAACWQRKRGAGKSDATSRHTRRSRFRVGSRPRCVGTVATPRRLSLEDTVRRRMEFRGRLPDQSLGVLPDAGDLSSAPRWAVGKGLSRRR
jgi:hypothetical protein